MGAILLVLLLVIVTQQMRSAQCFFISDNQSTPTVTYIAVTKLKTIKSFRELSQVSTTELSSNYYRLRTVSQSRSAGQAILILIIYLASARLLIFCSHPPLLNTSSSCRRASIHISQSHASDHPIRAHKVHPIYFGSTPSKSKTTSLGFFIITFT